MPTAVGSTPSSARNPSGMGPSEELKDPPRAALGSFFRSVLAFLERRKLVDRVREMVSPATAKAMANPPFVFRWMGSTAIDEIEAALQKIGGPDLCRELGNELSKNLGTSIVKPVLRAAFFLFGETPEAVFGHLDRFFSLPTRGITFSWRPMVQGVGVVEATFAGTNCPEAAYYVLQGSLNWIFTDLLKVPGSVGPVTIVSADEKESRVTFEVRF